ncbi:UNVERIFIED_CONTAM: hypothetical protein Sradi_5063800 [Sesamum radiatum]|uniref:DUF4283 domain-containing protein n=1 Tax=Sesamum radiatum TaxID=300843 RepID=A0AAW2M0E7_SESRA
MAPFTLNPDEFPPLTTNSSESTRTNSAKTTSFQQGQNAEIAGCQSANRIGENFNFSKFFFANSNPPPIGATHDINGRPTVIFSDLETQSLVANFRLALIGKFSQGTPPYSQLHRLLVKSGIKGAFTVSLINNKHALISLSNESDFTRLWLRRIWYLNGFPMRVFKWSPTFTPEQESSIIPIWVNFSELPAHLYRKDALFAIANNIGTPLQIADSTFNQSNLAKARVCVEIDLIKPLLKEIDLNICGATIVQNIVYEDIPNYCSLCKHVGHCDAECYSKGDAPKPPPHRGSFGKKAAANYKLKGKAVIQQVDKVLDKIPEKTKVGECSKNAIDNHRYVPVAVFNSQKEIVELPQPVCNDEAETCCAENVDLVAEKDAYYVENDICDAENDSIRVMETVVELDGNGNVGCGNTSVMEVDVNWQEDIVTAENYILDCENIGLACGIEGKNVNKKEENDINLGGKIVGTMITRPNNIVDDLRRGKKWVSVDIAVRLIQNWKRFGVVIKGIKEDVETVIKRNKLAVSSAIQFHKCVLLFDPVRQLYLKPLDTGEQFDQVLQDPEPP